MNLNFMKKLLSTTLTILLLVGAVPFEAVAQSGQPGYSGQGAALSAQELQQLVAPIALYPDSLVMQLRISWPALCCLHSCARIRAITSWVTAASCGEPATHSLAL